MSIGWICVSIMTMFVALSMAEVVSAVPTAGGPYHWGESNVLRALRPLLTDRASVNSRS